MDENKFWVNVWSLGVLAFIGFTGVLTLGSIHDNYTMLQMVEKGADPIKARCALYGSGEKNAAMCVLVVQGKS